VDTLLVAVAAVFIHQEPVHLVDLVVEEQVLLHQEMEHQELLIVAVEEEALVVMVQSQTEDPEVPVLS